MCFYWLCKCTPHIFLFLLAVNEDVYESFWIELETSGFWWKFFWIALEGDAVWGSLYGGSQNSLLWTNSNSVKEYQLLQMSLSARSSSSEELEIARLVLIDRFKCLYESVMGREPLRREDLLLYYGLIQTVCHFALWILGGVFAVVFVEVVKIFRSVRVLLQQILH